MISVIIPLYNKEPIIERSLRSVLSQDYDNFEVIVVNDGSTDRSANIVRSINDTRVRLIEQENGGPSKARNTGVKNARGEWIVFLDADDELLPRALTHFSNLIISNPSLNIFCCQFYSEKNNKKKIEYLYRDGCIIKNNFKEYFYRRFFPHTGAAVYSRDILHKYMFDERIRRFEDVEQLFRVFRKEKIYLSATTVLLIHLEYVSASRPRINVNEDFVGHIDLRGKNFWEKMCLYQLFLGEREYYSKQLKRGNNILFYRYDLLLMSKLLSLFV